MTPEQLTEFLKTRHPIVRGTGHMRMRTTTTGLPQNERRFKLNGKQYWITQYRFGFWASDGSFWTAVNTWIGVYNYPLSMDYITVKSTRWFGLKEHKIEYTPPPDRKKKMRGWNWK